MCDERHVAEQHHATFSLVVCGFKVDAPSPQVFGEIYRVFSKSELKKPHACKYYVLANRKVALRLFMYQGWEQRHASWKLRRGLPSLGSHRVLPANKKYKFEQSERCCPDAMLKRILLVNNSRRRLPAASWPSPPSFIGKLTQTRTSSRRKHTEFNRIHNPKTSPEKTPSRTRTYLAKNGRNNSLLKQLGLMLRKPHILLLLAAVLETVWGEHGLLGARRNSQRSGARRKGAAAGTGEAGEHDDIYASIRYSTWRYIVNI